MKIKLVMLDNPIIVSDEEIKEGDLIFNRSGLKYDEQVISRASKNAEINWASNMKINGGKTSIRECIFKIVAGIPELPKIDYSGLESEFGYVDVDKLAKEEHQFNHKSVNEISFRLGFIEGFKKAQELNDKKFSLEDMRKAFANCFEYRGYDYRVNMGDLKIELNKLISQPKVFDIEVEMEMIGNPHEYVNQPKITEGKIKIIKRL